MGADLWVARMRLRAAERSAFAELDRAPLGCDFHRVLGAEFAFEDALRERILDARLDRALERTRAIHRIEAGSGDLRQRAVGHVEPDVHPRQALPQNPELDFRDALDVLFIQGMEHHDLVDAVDELGTETVSYTHLR